MLTQPYGMFFSTISCVLFANERYKKAERERTNGGSHSSVGKCIVFSAARRHITRRRRSRVHKVTREGARTAAEQLTPASTLSLFHLHSRLVNSTTHHDGTSEDSARISKEPAKSILQETKLKTKSVNCTTNKSIMCSTS